MKKCSRCAQNKPLDQFYKKPNGKAGHLSQCVECILEVTNLYKLKTRPSGPREARAKSRELLTYGLKVCKGCQQIKMIFEFYPVKNGRPAPYCKECDRKKSSEWAAANRDHLRTYTQRYDANPVNRARRLAGRKKRVQASPRYTMKITLSHGLRRKPTINPATIEDLMQKWRDQNGCCALTGIKMTWAKGKVLPTSISLDRIDHEGGYSADNIRLICHAINAFRGRMSDAEMLDMARALIAKADATAGPTWKPHLIHSEAA
jgi:hypothetical protein